MAISAVGQRISIQAIRHTIATLLVFGGLFYALYGPPLTQKLSDSAHRECNQLTGSTYRSYRLEWRTTTYRSLDVPHWECYRINEPTKGHDLGWWTGF